MTIVRRSAFLAVVLLTLHHGTRIEARINDFRPFPSHTPFLPVDTVVRQPVHQSYDLGSACGPCHATQLTTFVGEDSTHYLNQRLTMDRTAWADSLQLKVRCGTCHTLVTPEAIPQRRWPEVVMHMRNVFVGKQWPHQFSDSLWMDILHYYASGATALHALPPDPVAGRVLFTPEPIGLIPEPGSQPMIGNVRIIDVDRDGLNDVLVADFNFQSLSWIHREQGEWTESLIRASGTPAKAEPLDFNNDGYTDFVLTVIGNPMPTEDTVGRIELLVNNGDYTFTATTILDSIGRASDARPGDFDGDGDIDFVVAIFGYLLQGEIGWLEQLEDGTFSYHRLIKKAGGIHTIPVDLDGDGRLDIVTVIAQEHEEIIALMNQGDGKFRQVLLFKAFAPSYGMSGIEVVDLDRDGDLDVLASNGDAVDLPDGLILPYHGVQWLENKGGMNFEYHSIYSFYGAYRAVSGDIDRDGDLDIAVVTMMNDWDDTNRMSAIWLENNGDMTFRPHAIGNRATFLMTADLGDIDGDGDLDLVTGGMNIFRDPYDRIGRVFLWTNEGVVEETRESLPEE